MRVNVRIVKAAVALLISSLVCACATAPQIYYSGPAPGSLIEDAVSPHEEYEQLRENGNYAYMLFAPRSEQLAEGDVPEDIRTVFFYSGPSDPDISFDANTKSFVADFEKGTFYYSEQVPIFVTENAPDILQQDVALDEDAEQYLISYLSSLPLREWESESIYAREATGEDTVTYLVLETQGERYYSYMPPKEHCPITEDYHAIRSTVVSNARLSEMAYTEKEISALTGLSEDELFEYGITGKLLCEMFDTGASKDLGHSPEQMQNLVHTYLYFREAGGFSLYGLPHRKTEQCQVSGSTEGIALADLDAQTVVYFDVANDRIFFGDSPDMLFGRSYFTKCVELSSADCERLTDRFASLDFSNAGHGADRSCLYFVEDEQIHFMYAAPDSSVFSECLRILEEGSVQ